MRIHEALAELVRRYPEAREHQARITAGDAPGWRCSVAAWSPDGIRFNVYGRADTFEGALADAERRELAVKGERRAYPRASASPLDFTDLPPGGGL